MEEPRRGLYLRWEMSSSTFSMAIAMIPWRRERSKEEKREIPEKS
jgi:hypothetical protein